MTASHAPSIEELGRLDGAARKTACRSYVAEARAAMRMGLERGESPAELFGALAAAYDALLGALIGEEELGEAHVCLVALGGYGRRELYPFSDLDLLILRQPGTEQMADRLLERVVYPLWDAKLTVGHAVRSVDEALDLAASDLTMRTALLDARRLLGDEGPYHALTAGAYREFFGPEHVNQFVAALAEERARRHARFGESVYLLEPNVKSGKGGLRDLNTALWAATARHGLGELDELPRVGAATARQCRALAEARAFLQNLRLATHLAAGRAQDRLLFDLQEVLAPRLFPEQEVRGVRRSAASAPAVERLMHAYYRHARTVVIETDGILERCCVNPAGGNDVQPAEVRSIDPVWEVQGQQLVCLAPEVFWERPAEMLRGFALAAAEGLELARATRDVLAEAAASEPGHELAASEEGARWWLELLQHATVRAGRSVLQSLHDAGLLCAVIPELAPCTGRVQHDVHHVYTVDQHSLYVVELLHAFARGEQPDLSPTAAALATQDPPSRSLLLAALLHDVGKPYGSDHSGKGARLVAGVAARLGLEREEQDLAVFLVAQHLSMARISQRRDLGDDRVIADFAALVGNVERLRALYLLTVADTAMTAPGNLTSWKASLLDELYRKTYHELRDGDGAAARREEEVGTRRESVRALLRRHWGDAGEQVVERAPRALLAAHTPEALQHFLGVALELDQEPEGVVRIGTRPYDASTTELTICCDDGPGLLATMTGVMLARRISVLAAQIYTLPPDRPGGGPHHGRARALDVFWVHGPPSADYRAWSDFAALLEGALRGEHAVSELVARATRPSALPARALPKVATEVHVHNEASERCTILELQTADRVGLLYAVTRTLADLELEILFSKVETEAGRVTDVFYLQERATGQKVTLPERLTEIARAVRESVSRGDG
ncbi:MAG: [protein-PII] uridylyltransferase [Deltaproteobacteria bacterium]|nr:[protein-PII] uridylyltransferase [Deltaproteobacteria bacterium]